MQSPEKRPKDNSFSLMNSKTSVLILSSSLTHPYSSNGQHSTSWNFPLTLSLHSSIILSQSCPPSLYYATPSPQTWPQGFQLEPTKSELPGKTGHLFPSSMSSSCAACGKNHRRKRCSFNCPPCEKVSWRNHAD